MQPEFRAFPKIARIARSAIVTEKIDGTNAVIYVDEGGAIVPGSRNRWLVNGDDNFGFARWVYEHQNELRGLGPGYHYGEWWGKGIQRGYGLKEKRFSLFNVTRWADPAIRPVCCHVVPVLAQGLFSLATVDAMLTWLREFGSAAAPGFMRPEGVVVFHVAGGVLFKKMIEADESPKGAAS